MTIWWYLTRSTGIVAAILAVGSVVWGTRFSARATGTRLRPNWWLDLHNWLGGLALAFTIVHVVAAVADSDSGLRVIDALVPGQAQDLATAVSFGVVATYLFVLVVFTSWPKKRLPRRAWRAIHLLSLPALVLVGVHTFQLGSDAASTALRVLTVSLVAMVLYPLGLRLFSLRSRR
jgi:methionine sulfoxide reductase heme-binding subunit